MVEPDDVKNALNVHFEQITLNDFKEKHEKYVHEADTDLALPPSEDSHQSQMMLYQPEAAPLALTAYLACALTSLDDEQRERVFEVSDLVAAICEDLQISVYEPRKATDPVKHADVSAETVYKIDKERVLDSDLLIHICDYPSTGSGEELEFANSALLPILLISREDTRISRMVTGIPAFKLIVTYSDLNELKFDLRERLTEIRPILEERKLSFSSYDKNIVGNKIRILREELGLTREDVATSTMGLLTVEELSNLEDSTDRHSNPPLLKMRTLAAILKTTVADLVEPDLDERLLVLLQGWVDGKEAARYGSSARDRDKILRRYLLRLADRLETDAP